MLRGQQLAFNDGNLSVNHSVYVQLTAAIKGKMLRRVCEYFRMA
jgi:hypothetical protein